VDGEKKKKKLKRWREGGSRKKDGGRGGETEKHDLGDSMNKNDFFILY